VTDIQIASSSAVNANAQSVEKASNLSADLSRTATRTKSDITKEAVSVKADVASSKTELQAVHQLQPEFDSMRAQLGKATTDLATQQKIISSSENFVKAVFSSHAVALFTFDQLVKPNSIVIPSSSAGVNTVVYMLLPATPIPGTLQVQYHIYVQPPTSYVSLHNLVIFSWADPADNLRQKQMSVSYFPDSSDKDLIHALSQKDGRAFADDQPLPKFGQPDPDFRGNKWMTIVPAPAPAPSQAPR
jgi:hypothetical protein